MDDFFSLPQVGDIVKPKKGVVTVGLYEPWDGRTIHEGNSLILTNADFALVIEVDGNTHTSPNSAIKRYRTLKVLVRERILSVSSELFEVVHRSSEK